MTNHSIHTPQSIREVDALCDFAGMIYDGIILYYLVGAFTHALLPNSYAMKRAIKRRFQQNYERDSEEFSAWWGLLKYLSVWRGHFSPPPVHVRADVVEDWLQHRVGEALTPNEDPKVGNARNHFVDFGLGITVVGVIHASGTVPAITRNWSDAGIDMRFHSVLTDLDAGFADYRKSRDPRQIPWSGPWAAAMLGSRRLQETNDGDLLIRCPFVAVGDDDGPDTVS